MMFHQGEDTFQMLGLGIKGDPFHSVEHHLIRSEYFILSWSFIVKKVVGSEPDF